MHETGNLHHLSLVDAEGIGVGHHDTSNSVVEQALEVVSINSAIGCGLHLHNLKSAYRSTGRVGSMSTIGYDDTGTLGVATQ